MSAKVATSAMIAIRIGKAAITVTGASVTAASASTVILAVGSACAIACCGWGVYKKLSDSDRGSKGEA